MTNLSVLRMDQLSIPTVFDILAQAQLFESTLKDWHLPMRDALVANLFFEPSTRTHFSFVSAQQQLGCQSIDFNADHSSLTKGESLYDTVKTLATIGYRVQVIRHYENHYFEALKDIDVTILNAGDGAGHHPSQCLLDLLTIQQEFGGFKGLNVLIAGDILHSRVAHSNADTLTRLGANVAFSGPQDYVQGLESIMSMDEGVKWADVVMLLRVQKERGAKIEQDYLNHYGLTKARYATMKKKAIICHPAPVNRGIEIDSELVEADKSRIFKQMANGVLIRKALIKRAFGY